MAIGDDSQLLICSRTTDPQHGGHDRLIRRCAYCPADVFVSRELLERIGKSAPVVIGCIQCAVFLLAKQPMTEFATPDDEHLAEISAGVGRTVTRAEYERLAKSIGMVSALIGRKGKQ